LQVQHCHIPSYPTVFSVLGTVPGRSISVSAQMNSELVAIPPTAMTQVDENVMTRPRRLLKLTKRTEPVSC